MSNESTIWNFLKGKGLTEAGIAGLMGNLKAESGLSSTNLQNSYESKLGSDSEYTANVDNGSYTNFANDSAGYGLAQWTYKTRKANLLSYAKKCGKSIGNLGMQLDFLYSELSSGYASVLKVLKNTSSVTEASNAVLTGFEKPANQETSVQTQRASYGQVYYDQFHTSVAAASTTSAPTYTVGKTYILQAELKVRTGAGTNYAAKTNAQLSTDGKKHDADKDGALDKGTVVTCKAIKTVGSDIWMQTPSGWLAAYYQGNTYIK